MQGFKYFAARAIREHRHLPGAAAHRRHFVPRLRAATMLSSPGGFSGGNGARFGTGGSSLLRMARIRLMRGDMGKRSAAIVSRSSAAIAAQSSGEDQTAYPIAGKSATQAQRMRPGKPRNAA